jgi:hypothetical protein
VGSFDDERERRCKWAREVLDRLGIGMAHDESGFFRPAKRPQPGVSENRRRLQASDRQLVLNFEQSKPE